MVRHRETICPLRSESRCDRESKRQGVLGAGVHPPTKVWTSPLSVDTPDEGALCEVMVKILTRKNLATRISQVEASVSLQGISEMLPKFQDLSPMCPNTGVTSVIGMDRE